MDFGSAFTYAAPVGEDDVEEVDEERLATPLTLPTAATAPAPAQANSGLFSFLRPTSQAPPRPPAPRRASHRPVYRRRADTNVLNVNLGTLGGEVAVQTGEPQLCSSCGACLSSFSTLTKCGEDAYDWTCEFCGAYHRLELDEGEMPVAEAKAVDYIIEPAPCPSTSQPDAAAAQGAATGGLVVFVLDVSGSMCVTTEVPGKVVLRGDRTAALTRLRGEGDDRDQYLPGERRDATYISRLQAVQAAVNAQIEDMSSKGVRTPVALITFAGEVTIYGDGSGEVTKAAGDRLENLQELQQLGQQAGRGLCGVDESASRLKDTLFSIEESGPTALGPAVAVALGMAQGKPGSKIVLCTDGLANVGLGALDELPEGPSEERTAIEGFYQGLGETAMSQGCVIDVVSIQGDDCDLENLGALCEVTGGSVTRVDPLGLQENFAGILQNPVLATNVNIKVLLHAGLKFRLDDGLFEQCQTHPAEAGKGGGTGVAATAAAAAAAEGAARGLSVFSKTVGNATADTELSFEYSIRDEARIRALGLRQLEKLPFQVQVEYTRLDGMKCMRVLSETRRLTTDRVTAERHAKLSVLSSHVTQQTAKLAHDGDYTSARANSRAYQAVLKRCVTNSAKPTSASRTYDAWNADMEELDDQLMENEAEEENLSAAGLVGFGAAASSSASMSSASMSSMFRMRKASRSKNDKFSSMLYSKKKTATRKYAQAEIEEEPDSPSSV